MYEVIGMRYEVKTSFDKSQIDQTLIRHDHLNNTHEQVCRKLIDLQDQGVRDALIKLGWTPPKTN